MKPKEYSMDRADRPGAAAEENDGFEPVLIEGRNAVIEALRAGRAFDKIFIQKDLSEPALGHIAAKAKDAGAVVVDADKRKLDAMSGGGAHQGVIAQVAAHEYAAVSDILNRARQKGEAPLIVICDEISDPHNLGAIIRTVDAVGAHGVIIPKRRSAGLTQIVAKTSAGAIEYVPVARVANISATIRDLKKEGIWVYGAVAEAENDMYHTDFAGGVALVIGSEGSGISRIVAENCDVLVKIPMWGEMSSLNASVAAAVLLFEVCRQRGAGGK